MEEVLASSEARAAVLISSKPGCFIAGADVKWLDAAKSKQDVSLLTRVSVKWHYKAFCHHQLLLLQRCVEYCIYSLVLYNTFFVGHFPQLVDISTKGQAMIQRMEDSPKPVVAAIHGSCLGGGSEVGDVSNSV